MVAARHGGEQTRSEVGAFDLTAGVGSGYPLDTEMAGRGFPTPAISSHAEVQDRTRAAGVYDRLTRMYRSLRTPLVVDRATSGDGSWASVPGLPGLGTEVRIADGFFSLASAGQVRHVIRLMARPMSDVGGSWVEAYVEAADGVHRLRGLGP